MVRTNLKGMCTYEISSMEDPKEEEDKLANDNEKEAEKMLAVGKDKFPGVKKSENDTRKKEKGEDKK